jgi:hypothetical protein
MEKYYCNLCKNYLSEDSFYSHKGSRKHTQCKNCRNKRRRESRAPLKCFFCKGLFKPKARGQYTFCSEKCRFLAKTDKSTANGCWIWLGHITKRGYGSFVPADGRKSSLAHRESYRIFNGPLDDTKFIIHSCDNAKCVNPKHLRLGSAKENSEDAKSRGRLNNKERLSEIQVLNIRRLYFEGTSAEVLAKIYKRNIGTIQDIIYRVTWDDV